MIKPIDIIKQAEKIAQRTSKEVAKEVKTATTTVDQGKTLQKVSSGVLNAYYGVKSKVLFSDFSDFAKDFKASLTSFKDSIPEKLYDKIDKATDSNNFALRKTIAEYYSPLKNSKTFEEVKKLYPEIELPNLNVKAEIENEIKSVIPKTLVNKVKSLKTTEAKVRTVDEFLDEKISKFVDKWEIKPEFNEIRHGVTEDIINGKFEGFDKPLNDRIFLNKMPLKYRFMHVTNPEEEYIQMLYKMLNNEDNIQNLFITTKTGKKINASTLVKHELFPHRNLAFENFITKSEKTANEFKSLTTLTTNEIKSKILEQAWGQSSLRRDFHNETSYGKPWSLVKDVWNKILNPNNTPYKTDKLIDAYLTNIYNNGVRTAEASNPIAKYAENAPYMDKKQIIFLKNIYKMSKSLGEQRHLLNSESYKNFKSQFNKAEMAKTIENMEEHYKNSFLKRFWTDERKSRFSQAIIESSEKAKSNIELSDKILTDTLEKEIIL